MNKTYLSTRDNQKPINFYQAIVQGIGDDGGLLVPNFELEKLDLNELLDLSYDELASIIISCFVDKDGSNLIKEACFNAYGKGLFCQEVVPVKKAKDVYITELFQGPTAAFKDMALSLLPYLMTLSLKQLNEQRQVMVLAATSGDTGKAALEGFKDVPGTSIKVFYPLDGVSNIQKQQMITQTGNNVKVIGIDGNFDNAQSAVKEAFACDELKKLCDDNQVLLSSANSINIGRLIPQIVYYFHSYIQLLKRKEIECNEKINFCVPSGNFGNCLAGYLAKQMGLPVNKFIVASNKNNILTDFFNTGKYDIRREFYKTNAPAMDILVSSNLERLIWFMENKNGKQVNEYMNKLKETSVYQISDETFNKIREEFYASYLDENSVLKTIKDCYKDTGYLLDTHTACGYGVLKNYQKITNDQTKTVVLATASPYKFPESVYQALTDEVLSPYQAITKLNEDTNIAIPYPLKDIENRPVLHKTKISKTDIINFIKEEIKGV